MKPAFALLAMLFLMPGCVRSLHPVYTNEDLTYDAAFLGSWTEPEGDRLEITVGEDGTSYRITFHEDRDKPAELVGHLARLDDRLIANLTVSEKSLPDSDMYKMHLLAAHSFYFVRIENKTIAMQTIRSDWLATYLKKNPTAITHDATQSNQDSVLLTAPTAEVRTFLAKIVNEPGALTEPIIWRPAPSPATAPEKAEDAQ